MKFSLAALPLSLLLFACPTTEEEDPGEHACERVADAGTAVTASADAATAPVLVAAEDPYTVTLVDGAAGYVLLDAGDAEDVLLFLDTADVVVGLQDADGNDLGLGTGAPNEFCGDDIPEHYELEPAGGEFLVLGPAAVETVWISLLDADGHAHE